MDPDPIGPVSPRGKSGPKARSQGGHCVDRKTSIPDPGKGTSGGTNLPAPGSRMFSLQSWERIDFCCFKPPGLRCFIMASAAD